MKWFRLMCLAAMAVQLVGSGAAADRAAANTAGSGSANEVASRPAAVRTAR